MIRCVWSADWNGSAAEGLASRRAKDPPAAWPAPPLGLHPTPPPAPALRSAGAGSGNQQQREVRSRLLIEAKTFSETI